MEQTGPIRVLIADDEERFRSTTEAILKKRGFLVTVAADGPEAVGKVLKDGFDVVVLDLKMPGMDGNQALGEIKRIRPDVEVIMLTGHGTYDTAIAGLRGGVFEYLNKPCDIDLLIARIQDAFARKHGLTETESRIRDIMVPLGEFSTIREDRTVAEAMGTLARSFAKAMITSTLNETVHRSVLVLDNRGKVIGVLSFQDLLRALQPPHLRRALEKPSRADAVPREPPSHPGMFTIMVQDILKQPVRGLMSEVPPIVDTSANLMEAVNRMILLKVPRLLVTEQDTPVGVVREQDLFFEMVRILRQQR